jgi:serine/threonine-protein kinase RsbW
VSTGGWRGPGWRVVDAHPRHAKQIRDWISAAITRHDCPVDPADAALAVSELFANAVMHGPPQGQVLVGYCLWVHGARIVVCDGGDSRIPELRQVTGQAEGGRGLHVIDSVTARWGSFHLTGNLVTWCDLGQPVNSPASDAWAWLRTALAASGPLFVPPAQEAGPGPGPADPSPLIPVSAAGPAAATDPSAAQPGARMAMPCGPGRKL